MQLLLHTQAGGGELSEIYRLAFSNATELFIVTAFLTEWDASLQLNEHCKKFRIIVGKDFGITRKAACECVMHWLPAKRKSQFMVADRIGGFHPKMVFWKESDNRTFAIVGSSNLTRAAFETNYEANIYCQIAIPDYEHARRWVWLIERQSLVVSEDWLKKYHERPISPSGGKGKDEHQSEGGEAKTILPFNLPRPRGMQKKIQDRRAQLIVAQKSQPGLTNLFRRCAAGQITSGQFYQMLPTHWSVTVGNRFQGPGFERQGKDSDFRRLSQSVERIVDSPEEDRDDVVSEEIDALHEAGEPTRKAFLSEMLCLMFPPEYPLLDEPVQKYLKAINFRAPRGASEGAKYVDLAKKLRFSLLQNPDYPAKNLAELDVVIWLKYGKRQEDK
jgi:HKD family nuclease